MEIKIFQNAEFGSIRTAVKDDVIWFVGKDVAQALGYERATKAIQDHVDSEDKDVIPIQDSIGRMQNTPIINESGVYALVFGSKLPTAKKFKHWVTSEVLPSIRKNGGYIHTTAEDTPDVIMAKALLLADATIKEQKAMIEKQAAQIEADAPKVLFADTVITSEDNISIGALAKLLSQKGINTGEKKLFDWLRTNGYLFRRRGGENLPMQKYINSGLMVVEENAIKIKAKSGTERTIISLQTKITPKGQVYLIDKISRELV